MLVQTSEQDSCSPEVPPYETPDTHVAATSLSCIDETQTNFNMIDTWCRAERFCFHNIYLHNLNKTAVHLCAYTVCLKGDYVAYCAIVQGLQSISSLCVRCCVWINRNCSFVYRKIYY